MPRDPKEPPDRPDLYVLARFLDRLAESDAGYTRSRLQAAVRLNYDLFRAYLRILTDKGLVEAGTDAAGREVLRITAAGRDAHKELVGWIREVLGDVFR